LSFLEKRIDYDEKKEDYDQGMIIKYYKNGKHVATYDGLELKLFSDKRLRR
jgi:hypothetical protein